MNEKNYFTKQLRTISFSSKIYEKVFIFKKEKHNFEEKK